MTPLDYMLCIALSYVGFQLRTAGVLARDHVASAYADLVDSIGSRGLITTRAARLACRALLMALDECALGNVSPHARQLARAEALTALRALLDGDAPPDPRAELARAWAAWRGTHAMDECVALAHAALRVGALYVEGDPSARTIGDLTGQRLARELGRADLLGEAEGPGPVAVAPEAAAPVRAPRARLEVV